MESKICLFLCIIVMASNIKAFVINEQDKQKISTDLLDAFQHALDEMRKCLDQMMAKTVDQVNTQALEPVFTAVGDNLDRITKAIHAFVKRDAPAAGDSTQDAFKKIQDSLGEFGKDLSEKAGEILNPENIKKNFNELVDSINKGIEGMKTPNQ
ncbi:uncharacterized protein LOC121740585 [Aricia agestis]|uniref:uncharacterized protein LOC121740585 n=1 Tax=Aricia agestis TaxID=91739 RepID=UPI001C202706|nr:uncharacterized protein LOC121740585 [Aricia agestis]